MAIVSKRIEYRRPQINGFVKVREEHTDQFGNLYYIGPYFVTSNAEADATLAARDLTPDLILNQLDKVKIWVADRNTVASYDFTNLDIIEDDAEEDIVKHFARSPGEEAFKYAWWIESLNPPIWSGICSRLGWLTTTGEIGERVQSRAINLAGIETDFYRIEQV